VTDVIDALLDMKQSFGCLGDHQNSGIPSLSAAASIAGFALRRITTLAGSPK